MSTQKRPRRTLGPLYYFLFGLILLFGGGLLVADDQRASRSDGSNVFFADDVSTQLVVGLIFVVLGLLLLAIWLIAFAVSIGMAQTNMRLERLDDLQALAWYAEQAYAPRAAPAGLGLKRDGAV